MFYFHIRYELLTLAMNNVLEIALINLTVKIMQNNTPSTAYMNINIPFPARGSASYK